MIDNPKELTTCAACGASGIISPFTGEGRTHESACPREGTAP